MMAKYYQDHLGCNSLWCDKKKQLPQLKSLAGFQIGTKTVEVLYSSSLSSETLLETFDFDLLH